MNRLLTTLLVLGPLFASAGAPNVTAIRCPDGGVQPQVAVDSTGKVHLIYLKGDEGKSDVFYTTSRDGGRTWAAAIRVNSQPGAAIAVGTVRGAHLAIGRGDRPHVAWMGSSAATPKATGDATPLLYARLNDAGDAFEPQRNVITSAAGLDGGGSVAADAAGNVYVAWHAPIPGTRGEENRRVWLSVSKDEGKTFAPETLMSKEETGACGCCGMRLGVDAKGSLVALYRAANPQTRDIYLLTPKSMADYAATKVQTWPVKTCPMSTAAFARAADRSFVAWETAGQVSFAAVDGQGTGNATAAPGKGNIRKHPSLAVNADGVVLLAWTEGTGWKRGGSLAWQLFDGSRKPVGQPEMRPGLAVWSLPAAFANPDGSFAIVY
jgi:hypothetical protein